MTWTLPDTEHRKFERNPLVAVVVQLRFHPILKIADKIADFQERVRPQFPVFLEGSNEVVSIKSPNDVEVKSERQFLFKTTDESCSITLSISAIAVENRKHVGHEAFLEEVRMALDSLIAVYAPIAPHRLGMRYINILDRVKIGEDLEREVRWQDLVSEEFLRMPAAMTDLDQTLFANEVSSPVGDGALTLRYGLLPGPSEGTTQFRFDLDRYVDGSFDVGTAMDKLLTFTGDLYAPFDQMIAPSLVEWMKPIDAPEPADTGKPSLG